MVFLFLLLIVLILLITSKIRIEIYDLRFIYKKTNTKEISSILEDKRINPKNQSHLNDKYNIKIKLQVLNKIPILWTNINKEKIQKLKENEKFKNFNLNFKEIKNNISLKQLKQAKKQIKIEIKKFYLKAEIGTDSTMFTSVIIPLISSGISIILARKKVKLANQNFQIKPIYNCRQFVKTIFIWCI